MSDLPNQETAVELLPDEVQLRVGTAFDGMFGEGVPPKVLAHLVADPFHEYSVAELRELVGCSPPALRHSLDRLVQLGMASRREISPRRIGYSAIPGTNRFAALALLSYGVIDDHQGTTLMRDAAADWLQTETGFPLFFAAQTNLFFINLLQTNDRIEPERVIDIVAQAVDDSKAADVAVPFPEQVQ
jgi:DNA-binding HxlR family transcriptional regulator